MGTHLTRAAIALGVGLAATTTGTPADAAPVRTPQTSVKALDTVRVWTEGDRLFMHERGITQELHLADSEEVRYLRTLLGNEQKEVQPKVILVGGGGNSIGWGNKPKSSPDSAQQRTGATAGGGSVTTGKTNKERNDTASKPPDNGPPK